MGFVRSLSVGKTGEQWVLEKLLSEGKEAGLNTDPATRSFFDVVARDGPELTTYEVKCDKRCKETGNVAIEFYNPKSGCLTGISTSLSDYWVLFVGDEVSPYVVKTDELRRYCSKNPSVRRASSGEKNADVLLYRWDSIKEIFGEWR